MADSSKIPFTKNIKSSYPFAFGTASIAGEAGGYSFGNVSESDSVDLLKQAFDLGISVFDSAPIYGFREAEKRLGIAFKDKREEVCLISKCGVSWHSSKRVNMTNDPKVCQKMLENTLRDFGSSYVDLYMVHWPDAKIDIRYPLEYLAKAQIEGKIKSIGLCNTNLEDLEKATELCDVEVVQAEWSPVATHNRNLRNYCQTNDLTWMSWGCLDKGILTGRVDEDRKFDETDCRSWAPWWKKQKKQWKYDLVKQLKPVLEKEGFSLLDFAVSFQKDDLLRSFGIYGTRTPKQLESLMTSYKTNLPIELQLQCIDLCKQAESANL